MAKAEKISASEIWIGEAQRNAFVSSKLVCLQSNRAFFRINFNSEELKDHFNVRKQLIEVLAPAGSLVVWKCGLVVKDVVYDFHFEYFSALFLSMMRKCI